MTSLLEVNLLFVTKNDVLNLKLKYIVLNHAAQSLNYRDAKIAVPEHFCSCEMKIQFHMKMHQMQIKIELLYDSSDFSLFCPLSIWVNSLIWVISLS